MSRVPLLIPDLEDWVGWVDWFTKKVGWLGNIIFFFS